LLDMGRPKKIHEPRRAVAYRLRERLVAAMESLADEHRRSFTAELELAIEAYLSKHKRLPPPPSPEKGKGAT
jgi:hypothetical protein